MEVKEKEIVQDIRREKQLAELLKLNRMVSRWGHDAENGMQNHYELKTTTKTSFGTGRDVSLKMIDIWRKRYWIFARGINYTSGFVFEEIYFLSPKMLEIWFQSMEKKFKPDIKIRDLVISKVKADLNDIQLSRLKYLIDRGMTYNNPHIGLNYVRKSGIPLNIDNCANELKRLVAKNPL